MKSEKKLQLVIKRFFDIILACIGIISLIPITVIIFIINIIFNNHTKIFYKHERIGKNGKKFMIYKFRTMTLNADEELEEILKNNKEYRKEWEEKYKLKYDPRITKVGDFLRKTSIDEMPQFINVLKGDMSIVGPRPVIEKELKKFGDKKDIVLSMRPGITGYWATHGRNNTTYEERVNMEEKYVKEFSLFLDLKLLLKTIVAVITKEGAV